MDNRIDIFYVEILTETTSYVMLLINVGPGLNPVKGLIHCVKPRIIRKRHLANLGSGGPKGRGQYKTPKRATTHDFIKYSLNAKE